MNGATRLEEGVAGAVDRCDMGYPPGPRGAFMVFPVASVREGL